MMTRAKLLFPLVASALLLAGCGSAQLYLYKVFGPDHHYVAAERVLAVVPAPPEPGSPADKADFEALFDWQARRSEADCAGARAQAKADYDKFFGDISPFPAPLPPEVSSILFKVYYDGGMAVGAAKERFGRQRPFKRDKALKPCLGKVGGLSYPSGHATVSRLFALLLSDVAPARRGAFLARSDQAALNRVIGGVHHPSDIEAGKALGDAVYAELLKEARFLADLERLKALASPAEGGQPARPAGTDGP
jgi:acid phosphatase (class A)